MEKHNDCYRHVIAVFDLHFHAHVGGQAGGAVPNRQQGSLLAVKTDSRFPFSRAERVLKMNFANEASLLFGMVTLSVSRAVTPRDVNRDVMMSVRVIVQKFIFVSKVVSTTASRISTL